MTDIQFLGQEPFSIPPENLSSKFLLTTSDEVRTLDVDSSNRGEKRCPNAFHFLYHSLTWIIWMAMASITAIGAVYACRLFHLTQSKFSQHPMSNMLLLNSSVSTILCFGYIVTMMIRTVHALSVGDACLLGGGTVWTCAWELYPMIVIIMTFQLTLGALAIERGCIAAEALGRMRAPSNAIVRHPVHHQNSSGPCAIYKALAVALLIWALSIFVNLARTYDLAHESQVKMELCNFLHAGMGKMIAISIILHVATLALLMWTLQISREQLHSFTVNQAQSTLADRVNLRYNVHITEMVSPGVGFNAVCQLIAGGIYFLIHPQLSSLSPAAHQQIMLANFTAVYLLPMVLFAGVGHWKVSALREHGATLFIRTTTPMLSNSTTDNFAVETHGPGNGGPSGGGGVNRGDGAIHLQPGFGHHGDRPTADPRPNSRPNPDINSCSFRQTTGAGQKNTKLPSIKTTTTPSDEHNNDHIPHQPINDHRSYSTSSHPLHQSNQVSAARRAPHLAPLPPLLTAARAMSAASHLSAGGGTNNRRTSSAVSSASGNGGRGGGPGNSLRSLKSMVWHTSRSRVYTFDPNTP